MIPRASLEGLPAALTEEAQRCIAALASGLGASGLEYTLDESLLGRLFVASPFIAEHALRDPDGFRALIQPASLREDFDPQAFGARLAIELAAAGDESAFRRILRRERNTQLVRMACRDLLGLAELTTVLAEISDLADALLKGTLAWLRAPMIERYGTPVDEQGETVDFLVLAMGKLGGRELNFSSDIDLIFLFRAQGETRGGTRVIANQEFFDRLGKKLIAALNDVTADGFVYRVDMRLRPFGESGALTTSFSGLEHYYSVHGRDWERYALIKGRVINGDARDVQQLEAITRPFVFRRYLDFGALEAVREMKALINAEVARYGMEHDVKRGAGGIREVEFIGQMFQLIRGGREPRLRQRGIVAVLEVCAELDLIPATEVAGLVEAYRFLRITEHRLQQVRDEQTQALPESAEERARIAFSAGFADWPEFLAALETQRARVRHSFAALLNPTEEEAPVETGSALLWRDGLDPDRTQDILAAAGFEDLARTAAVLAQLKDPRFLGRLSQEARVRLDRLMPAMVAACAGREAATETLSRLAELVHAVARRSVYLALLADNPGALKRLVALCGASLWIARELTNSPILLDELLDSRNLFSPPARRVLERQLDEMLANARAEGLEHVMETLRVFKHQQVLRVAASDLMVSFPIAEVSNHLTWIAEVLIDRTRAIAWQALAEKHGCPVVTRRGEACEAGFAIIAYGKLGGLELGYGSDLDLVFVHDTLEAQSQTNGGRPIANDVFFTRLVQRIIHLLATRT
ncbi:MAG: bifunctional [glutamate--ammonia ligase]-adenylyl-L-tyrosine, partial [Pseudomonadota bacterium]